LNAWLIVEVFLVILVNYAKVIGYRQSQYGLILMAQKRKEQSNKQFLINT